MNLPLRVERASNAFYPAWNLRDPYDNLIAQDMLEDDAEYLAALANADHAKAKKPKAKKKEQPHA